MAPKTLCLLLICACSALAMAAQAADSPFTLKLPSDQAVVLQGETATLRVQVQRRRGFAEPVQLALRGLPPGLRAAPAVLAPSSTEALITLHADPGAAHSLPTTAWVEGSSALQGKPLRQTHRFIATLRGAAGAVDTSFAEGGAQHLPVGRSEDYLHALAVQPDGKLLVAGSSSSPQGTRMAVLRLLRDGGLDPGFGEQGRVLIAVGEREDVARALAVQPDGRIVVAGLSLQGRADYDFALVRLLPDGRLDKGFGNQGLVLTDFGGDSDRAFALLLMPDGRIVAGGQTNAARESSGVDFALARYRPDGSLDAGFGRGGKVREAILPQSTGDRVHGLALQEVGGSTRLLAVGGDGDFTAARFTEDGQLDPSFARAGKLSGLFGVSIGAAYAVTVLPSGEALLAGHVQHDFAAVRLSPDGQLDVRFGPAGDGRFRHAVSASNWDEATALVRQADGRLLLAGWVYSGVGTAGDFAVLRLSAEGRLDADFGKGGAMTQAVAGSKADFARAIALQPDERVPTVRAVMAGEAQGVNRDFALIRLWL